MLLPDQQRALWYHSTAAYMCLYFNIALDYRGAELLPFAPSCGNEQSNSARPPLGKLRNVCVNRKQTIPRSLNACCLEGNKHVTSGGTLQVVDVFHIHPSSLGLSHWAESYHLLL